MKHKIIHATKAITEALGFAVGDAVFPMKKYTEAEKREIVSALENAGLKLCVTSYPG